MNKINKQLLIDEHNRLITDLVQATMDYENAGAGRPRSMRRKKLAFELAREMLIEHTQELLDID